MSTSDINIRGLVLEDDNEFEGVVEGISPWETIATNPNPTVPRRTFNARDWAPGPLLNLTSNNGPWEEYEGGEDEQAAVSPLPVRKIVSPVLVSQQTAAENFDISQSIREEITDLEGTQNALLEQIRDLELAHAQLSAAREELLRVLAVLENDNEEAARDMLDSAHQRIIQRFEQQTQQRELLDAQDRIERQESYDFYEEILSNQMASVIPMAASMRRRFPIDDDDGLDVQQPQLHDSVLEMFLDENGDPCLGFEDCLQRAVGWSGEKSDFLDFGIDRNGQELEDLEKSSIEVELTSSRGAPLR